MTNLVNCSQKDSTGESNQQSKNRNRLLMKEDLVGCQLSLEGIQTRCRTRLGC